MTQHVLEVHGWHTQCRSCGYGRGGWAGGPAAKGLPILTPASTECHGCGVTFTHVASAGPYPNPMLGSPVPINSESEAA